MAKATHGLTEEVAARRLQRRPAEGLQQAELVDGDGRAEDEAQHPDDR